MSSGGQETVASGGIASGAVVNSGGLEIVSSGGTLSSATISGGVVEIGSNGVLSGAVIFASSGGTLRLDEARNYTSAFVSAFTSGDFIDFHAIAFNSSVLSWNQINASSGTLSITSGGISASITLLGQYMASQFTSANDGLGGTVVSTTMVVAQVDPLANPHST